ncbi:4-hydroxybenzoate octaprenyltransferase [Devosia sp. CN2-171]|jgi:4-hydroxybenzoate polyprenyltransferase|uniref:4-hydroxybenzoate octaprenyltransferase n=1 Tax=Devosia sp. CN2-171 TaxID=3400909 RepID=UPI003BF8201B
MQTPEKAAGTVADAQRGNWVDRYAPEWLKPYARLARWDRPIPLLLLFWPCGFGLALATVANPTLGFDVRALILFLIGSVAMRGAGCTFNDIVDTDIDMKVARTRSRPIPSGQVTKRQAALFLIAQSLVGLLILLQFNGLTVVLGVASLVLVAIYPFMKRVTWWPQLFLGLAFNWGALIGWTSQTGSLALPPLLLYAGSILWTIGYDTIYALQDVEDDALIGVRSTARLFGRRARLIVALFYAATVVLWVAAALAAGAGWPFLVAMLVPVGILVWQIQTLDMRDPANALVRFRANHWVGLALTLSLLVGLIG